MADHTAPATQSYARSDKRVIGYCMLVGLLAVTQGLDTGETAGFIAMPRYVLQALGD
jgi:hypothetical protein